MEIPIANSLHETNNIFLHNEDEFLYSKLNGINFINPKLNNFPLLKILKSDFNNTYYEIILVSINDALVRLYLNNNINYITIHNLMLKLLKKPYFTKYYNTCPRNLNDIKNMVKKVDQYLELYLVK